MLAERVLLLGVLRGLDKTVSIGWVHGVLEIVIRARLFQRPVPGIRR